MQLVQGVFRFEHVFVDDIGCAACVGGYAAADLSDLAKFAEQLETSFVICFVCEPFDEEDAVACNQSTSHSRSES